MDKEKQEKIKDELIKDIEIQIAEREARISEHKKVYEEAVAKEQGQIEVFEIKLKAYKKYIPV